MRLFEGKALAIIISTMIMISIAKAETSEATASEAAKNLVKEANEVFLSGDLKNLKGAKMTKVFSRGNIMFILMEEDKDELIQKLIDSSKGAKDKKYWEEKIQSDRFKLVYKKQKERSSFLPLCSLFKEEILIGVEIEVLLSLKGEGEIIETINVNKESCAEYDKN